jgi:signal transduction histidine kinase
VFEQLHDPVFVVGTEGYVLDLNRCAADVFDVDRRTAVGEAATAVIPRFDALRDERGDVGPLSIVGRNGRRPYEVTVREVTDDHGKAIGRLVVYHDVGEYLAQQQRLSVLNRVFRHDIRTETNLIRGYADRLSTAPGDERALSVVKESAERIHELSERTRTASDLFDPMAEPEPPVAVSELVEETAAALRDEWPHAEVSVDDRLPGVRVPATLRAVLRNLCSNAVQHNDAERPSVWIAASTEGAWIEFSVADDGPGIDPAEREVLQQGAETPLEHASGVGLWVVKWGVDTIGGRVSFADRDPEGTVVTVAVPLTEATELESDEADSTERAPARPAPDAGR